MAYTLYKSDGTLLVTIADGTVDSTTSLTLPGPNYVGYGRFLDENLVYLLENFAGNTAPSGENLLGQLWYNKNAKQLNVFTPEGYLPVSGTIISDTQPVNVVKGNTWYNETTGQYYYYDGTSWNLIGPAYTKQQGPSGAIPALVQDANVAGVYHNIIKIQYGGELAAIFCSDSQFVPSPAIPGFPTINPGITINNSIGYISYNNSNVAAYLPTDPTITNIISTWQANALAQGAEINAANAAIVTANLQLKEYSDYQDALITTAWQANATQQANQLTAANAAIVTANSAVVSYVNTLNLAMRANVTAANAAIVTANSATVNYVNDQISSITSAWQSNAAQQANQLTAANAAIVTANSAVVSYIVDLNSAMVANVTAANASVTAANAAIVTANSALKSYTDNQISSVTSAWQANAAQQANQLTAANAAIVTANSAVVSYVNTLNSAMVANVTAANVAASNANISLKAYTDNQITTANTALKNYADDQITTANSALKSYTDNQITTANSAVVSYVNTLNSAMRANVTAANAAITGANAAIVTANTAMKGYVDNQTSIVTVAWQANALAQGAEINAANAAIVTANTAMQGYVNNQVTTANTALKNYTDLQIIAANTAMKAYVDTRDSTVTSAWQANAVQQLNQINAANAAIVTNAYSNSKVAAYLPLYGGNVSAGYINFNDGTHQSTAYTGQIGPWTLVETISNFSVLTSASIGFAHSVNYYSGIYNDIAIKLYWASQNAATFVTLPIVAITAGQRIILGQRNSDGFHDLEPDQYAALTWSSLSSATGTFYFGGSTTITNLYLFIYAR